MAQIRAFIRQLDAALREIGRLDDARAARLVEAIGLTLREPAEPGSVRHVEQAASDVLHTLRGGDA